MLRYVPELVVCRWEHFKGWFAVDSCSCLTCFMWDSNTCKCCINRCIQLIGFTPVFIIVTCRKLHQTAWINCLKGAVQNSQLCYYALLSDRSCNTESSDSAYTPAYELPAGAVHPFHQHALCSGGNLQTAARQLSSNWTFFMLHWCLRGHDHVDIVCACSCRVWGWQVWSRQIRRHAVVTWSGNLALVARDFVWFRS